MAIQIANPQVIRKVESLSKASGLNKTAAIEKAVEKMLFDVARPGVRSLSMKKLITQFDQIPDRNDAFNPVEYDERGLPK
jgi:antitoxin VapB